MRNIYKNINAAVTLTLIGVLFSSTLAYPDSTLRVPISKNRTIERIRAVAKAQSYLDFQSETGGKTMPLEDEPLSAMTERDLHLDELMDEYSRADALTGYFNPEEMGMRKRVGIRYYMRRILRKRIKHPMRNIKYIKSSLEAIEAIRKLPEEDRFLLNEHVEGYFKYMQMFESQWRIYRIGRSFSEGGLEQLPRKSLIYLGKMFEHLEGINDVLSKQGISKHFRLSQKVGEVFSDKLFKKIRDYFAKYPIDEEDIPGSAPEWYEKAVESIEISEKWGEVSSWQEKPLTPFWMGISGLKESLTEGQRYFSEEFRQKLMNRIDTEMKNPELAGKVMGFRGLEKALADGDKFSHAHERFLPGMEDLLFAFGGAQMVLEGNYSIPKETEEPGVIILEEAWNPAAGTYETMDKLNIQINGSKNLFGVTGANEVGKSTTIEMIALCVMYFQMGLPIPAKAGEIGVFRNIYTLSPGIEGLQPGESQHTGLIKRLSELTKKVGPRDLVLIDEAHMGTDYKNLTALTTVLMKDLIKRGATILYATHMKSVMSELKESFPEAVATNKIVLIEKGAKSLRQIAAGIAERSYSTKTLEREGFPEEIIRWAQEIYRAMQEGRKIHSDELTQAGPI